MTNLFSLFTKKKPQQKIETIEGIEFKFRKNSLSKSLKITLKGSNSVLVTLPKRASYSFAREFAIKNLPQIKKSLPYVKTQNASEIEDLRAKAKAYLPQRLEELAKQFGYKYKNVTIKRLKTRWGSCSFKNNINLNLSLMTLENDLIDYVLLHELVHTVEKNHQKAFWNRLLGHMPDAKQRQKILKTKKVL